MSGQAAPPGDQGEQPTPLAISAGELFARTVCMPLIRQALDVLAPEIERDANASTQFFGGMFAGLGGIAGATIGGLLTAGVMRMAADAVEELAPEIDPVAAGKPS